MSILKTNTIFPELNECSLIRELHCYGKIVAPGKSNQSATQHRDIGKLLITRAEKLSKEHNYRKIEKVEILWKKHE